MRHEEGSFEARPDHAIKDFLSLIKCRSHRDGFQQPGVVDQGIDMTVTLANGGCNSFHIDTLRDIACLRRNICSQLCRSALKSLRIAADDHNLVPIVAEAARYRQTD